MDDLTPSEMTVPDRLAALIEECGGAFLIESTVFRKAADGQEVQLAKLKGRVPDTDEVGKLHGSGNYRLHVAFRKNSENQGRLNRRDIEFILGPEYDEAAEDARRVTRGKAKEDELERVLAMSERLMRNIRPAADNTAAILERMGAMNERMLDRIDRMEERAAHRSEKMFEAFAGAIDKLANQPRKSFREELEEHKAMAEVLGIGSDAGKNGMDWKSFAVEVVGMVAENGGKWMDMATAAQKSNAAKLRLLAHPGGAKVAKLAAQVQADPAKKAAVLAEFDAKLKGGPEETNKILEALGVTR